MHALLVRLQRRSSNADQLVAYSRVSLSALSLVFVLMLTVGCGGGASPVLTDNVTIIDARSGKASHSFQAMGEKRYMLLPFSAPQESLLGDGTYEVRIEGQSISSSASIDTALTYSRSNASQSAPSTEAEEILLNRAKAEQDRQSASKIHLEKAIASRQVMPSRFEAFFARSSHGAGAHSARTVSSGESISIFSPYTGEENSPIEGRVEANSGSALFVLDNRAGTERNRSAVHALAQDFETITLPRLKTLFGQPSDVDGNGKLIIYFASTDQMGSNELGFFRPADLLPDGTIDGIKSNEAEIVFVTLPSSAVSKDLVHATIAHELFHLINFAVKTLPYFKTGDLGSIKIEKLFMNEGLAHLAEELTGWGVDTELVTNIYLECLPYTSLSGSAKITSNTPPRCHTHSATGDSLARRGGMMLFLLYAFQQMGGAEYSHDHPGEIVGDGVTFLHDLNHTRATGTDGLEKASGKPFFEWLAQFSAMLALDNTSVVDDPVFHLHPTFVDPFTGLSRNLRLRASEANANPLSSSIVSISQNSTSTTGSENGGESSPQSGSSDLLIQGRLNYAGIQAIPVRLSRNDTTTLTVDVDPALKMGLTLIELP